MVGALVTGPLEGSLLVVMAFSVDVFSGPAMTSGGGLTLTPTRKAADLLVAAGGGQGSSGGDWIGVALTALGGVLVTLAAFWLSARSRAAR